MDNQSTRRDLFKIAGGAAAGILFTPAPWRLFTDTTLWTQNWSWLPKPLRGAIRTKFTNCMLCPAGCAVRVRCVEDQPVALAGVAGHPLSRGALCPFGLTGHHLPYHPARLKQASRRGVPVPQEQVFAAVSAAVAKCGPSESVAVLDLRPGRTASWTYRRAMAAIRNGVYLAPATAEGATARAVRAGLTQDPGPLAIDLEHTKTVLSLGAPLFDGWGTPGNVLAARAGLRLIHAEPVESRTAALADVWLPIKPGSEAALALSVAHVLIAEGKCDPAARRSADFERFAALAAKFPPEVAAGITGLAPEQIVATARDLAGNGPALVLADAAPGGGELAPEELRPVAALNFLLGAVGRSIVARREVPVPEEWNKAAPVTDLADAPDRSIRVLLIDESVPGELVPWNAIQRKLTSGEATVVAFACSPEGYGRFAEYVVPTPVYPEAAQDAPASADSPVASFRLAAPLLPAPAGVVGPADFVSRLAGQTIGEPLQERAAAVHKAGRGALFTYADAKSTPVKDVKPEDFWKALNEGGCWLDSAAEASPVASCLLLGKSGPDAGKIAAAAEGRLAEASDADLPLIAIPAGVRGVSPGAPASPLISKLYQESNLRESAGQAGLNPETARGLGLEEGAAAVLQTRCGKCAVRVSFNTGVRPGVVLVSAGPVFPGEPTVLDLCGVSGNGAWRMTRAKVARA